MKSLLASLRIAFFSAVIASILGTLICAALIRCRKAEGGMLTVVRLPILVPHAVVAVFTVALLSQTGIIPRIFYALGLLHNYNHFPDFLYGQSYSGAIIAYIWKESPFVAYFTLALMKSVGESLGEAAENLGASPVRRAFLDVTLPQLLPGILSSFCMSFIISYSQYFTTLLAGGGKIKTIALVLVPYIQSGDRALSSVYSVVFVGSALLVFAVFESILKKMNRNLQA